MIALIVIFGCLASFGMGFWYGIEWQGMTDEKRRIGGRP